MRIMIAGGVARSLINFRGPLLKTLVEKGHDIVACAPNADPEIRDKLSGMGVRYHHIPIARAGLSPVSDLKTIAAFRNIIRLERPDKILAYTVKPVIYSHLAARNSGNTQVYGMITGLGYAFGNGSIKQKVVGGLVRKLYRYALKSSFGVLFQNPDDRHVFQRQRLLPAHVPVILVNGSGVDLDWYISRPLPKEPVFLLIARLLGEKGIREYYQAAKRVKERHPQAKFQLAGNLDSNPDSISQEELDKWQKKGVIEYLGRLEDVRPALQDCRVYVLPSYYREGTPRTVLEAMATGRAVITTDTPGCRETVVDGENGFLVRPRDVHSLEQAMERFIQAPELAEKMGWESLRIARNKYDVHKVNEAIIRAMGGK
ncbi:MAG: glycosyltransferase family 4 protein [Desulfonatronovibrionaceae bacterium]